MPLILLSSVRLLISSSWRRWLLILLVAGALWFARKPILTGVAGTLIVDQQPGNLDFVWIRAADGISLDAAAAICRESLRRRVVLVARRPSRLVRAGIYEPIETIARRELTRLGVSLDRLEVLNPPATSSREELARLETWLESRPGAQVALPCQRLWSACQRQFLDETLRPATASRIRVLALSDGLHDETNWWDDRAGIRDFMYAFISRVYLLSGATRRSNLPEWDPDEYERTLRESLRQEGH